MCYDDQDNLIKKSLTDMIKLPKGWTEETIGS